MNIIRHIVQRCNVGMTNREVIRYTISRLKHKEKTFYAMPKHDRKEFMRICIREHAENRQLYKDVMQGNF